MTARHVMNDRSIRTVLAAALAGSLGLAALPGVACAADDAIGTVRQIYDGKLLPDIQARTFRNIDKLFPTRTIRAAGKDAGSVRELPVDLDPTITDLSFKVGDKTHDLYETISVNRIAGLIVLKDGKIKFEDYELGNDRQTRWMSMSVAKSMTSTLIAAAIEDGDIASIDDRLETYLPQLKDSAYGSVTVAQLLTMSSGVKWSETYTNPASDRRHMLDLQIAQKPGAIVDYMASLPKAHAPGTAWNYSTGETSIAAALVHAATGKNLADYLSEKIWTPYGMESDATWWLGSPDGLEVGGSGVSATLRDYARLGQFVLDGGKVDGKAVVPDDWFPAAGQPRDIGGKTVGYGRMWWPVAKGEAFKNDQAFAAIGIYGQYVYVNPTRKIVIAMWGAQPKPLESNPISEYSFLEALAAKVDGG